MHTKIKDYYHILGLETGATGDQIKSAFRRLAFQWHPDRHKSHAKLTAHEKFIEITEAYEILGNSLRRKEYDAYFHSDESQKTKKEYKAYADHMAKWQSAARENAKKIARESFERFSQIFNTLANFIIKDVLVGENLSDTPYVYDQAIKSCLDGIKSDPSQADNYYGLGFLHYKKGKYKEAAKYFKCALSLNANDADSFYGLGQVRCALGDFDKALNCFKKVLELRADDAEAWFYLGKIYAKKKQTDKFSECVDRLRKLKRDDLVLNLTKNS